MKLTISRLLVAAAILTSTPAYAEWLEIGGPRSGAVWYMDPNRIKPQGDRTHAWVKIDYSKDPSVKYRQALRLYSIICSSRKFKVLSLTEYDSYGKVVFSDSIDDTISDIGYRPATPESMGEAVTQMACPTQ